MIIKQFEHHTYSLVIKECDLVSIIMLARTSKKMYNIVENFLKYNKKFKQITIPKEISYNTNIHYVCEEFISKKCFKCGNSYNLFYYKYNRNLKLCYSCSSLCISIINRVNGELICEKLIKGFTKRELRRRLFYKTNTHSPPYHKFYCKKDVEMITKNRYGFKTYKEYSYFMTRRFDRINTKTIKENDEKVGINNKFLKYIKYKKGNSGFTFAINEKEVETIMQKIVKAQTRYDYCINVLKENEKIYTTILNLVKDEDKIRIYLHQKYNFRCIFEMKHIMFIEDFDYDGFFTDNIFKYFKSHKLSIDKVVKKILNY